MKITASRLKKKVDVKVSDVYKLIHTYTVDLCRYKRELYDLGYSNTPYGIDDFTVRKALIQEFPSYISLLNDKSSGGVNFTRLMAEYACIKASDDDFQRSIMAYINYKDTLKKLEDLNTFLTESKVMAKKIKTNVRFIASEGVELKSKVPLIPEMFYDTDTYECKTVEIGQCILLALLEDIGLSDKELEDYKNGSTSAFIEGFTKEQEYHFAELIVNSSVEMTGKYGDKLTKHIFHYYNSFNECNSHNTSQISYSGLIFTKSNEYIKEYLNEVRNEIEASNGYEVFMDNYSVSYAVPKIHTDWKLSQTIYVGDYIKNYSGSFLLTPDLFNGIQGVFDEDGTTPAYLEGFGNCYFAECSNDFKHSTLEELYYYYDSSSQDELLSIISKFTKNWLAAELVFAVLRARCEIYEYTFSKSVDNISKQEYDEACQEAIEILGYHFNEV